MQIVVAVLSSIGLIVAVVTFTPLVSWWANQLAGPWNEPSGDVLIVLGGSAGDDGILGDSSYWRSVYAVRTYRARPFRRVILSGGGDSTGTIAEPMAEFLTCHGVPPDALRLDLRSRNTRENAIYVKELLTDVDGKKILMTSDYHMFRAFRTFRKLNINVVPSAIPDATKRGGSFRSRFGAFVDLGRETIAIAYYFTRGWI
jgi:uncharacterized SAM-binding protein YcdF (DUF218 family)